MDSQIQQLRPDLHSIFMEFAKNLALRAECKRSSIYAKTGIVLVSPDSRQVIGFGYNGRARKEVEPCPGDLLGPGECGCLHAEPNAVANAYGSLDKCRAYSTTAPCPICARLLVNAGIETFFYWREYRNPSGIIILRNAGVKTICLLPLSVSHSLEKS